MRLRKAAAQAKECRAIIIVRAPKGINGIPIFEHAVQLLLCQRGEAVFQLGLQPLQHPCGPIAPGTQARWGWGHAGPEMLEQLAYHMDARGQPQQATRLGPGTQQPNGGVEIFALIAQYGGACLG